MSEQSDRQRQILNHLTKSGSDFLVPKPKFTSPERKKRIMDHVDRTRK